MITARGAFGVLAFFALGCATWGCSGPAPASRSVSGSGAAAPQSASYDGHYVGTVQVTGVSSSLDPTNCETDPQVSFDVSNNAFTYALTHPKVAGTSPGLTHSATTTFYNATIAPDGTITGSGKNTSGSLAGQITGAHMNGQIRGLLCGYRFTADRA